MNIREAKRLRRGSVVVRFGNQGKVTRIGITAFKVEWEKGPPEWINNKNANNLTLLSMKGNK